MRADGIGFGVIGLCTAVQQLSEGRLEDGGQAGEA